MKKSTMLVLAGIGAYLLLRKTGTLGAWGFPKKWWKKPRPPRPPRGPFWPQPVPPVSPVPCFYVPGDLTCHPYTPPTVAGPSEPRPTDEPPVNYPTLPWPPIDTMTNGTITTQIPEA